jgi:hypothetical protein
MTLTLNFSQIMDNAPYLSIYHMHIFFLKLLHKKPDAQNAKSGNIQEAAVDLATSFTQAVPAVRRSKMLDLQNFPLSCSRK